MGHLNPVAGARQAWASIKPIYEIVIVHLKCQMQLGGTGLFDPNSSPSGLARVRLVHAA